MLFWQLWKNLNKYSGGNDDDDDDNDGKLPNAPWA